MSANHYSSLSDDALVELCRIEGDFEALAYLVYNRYGEALRSAVRARSGGGIDIDEMVHDFVVHLSSPAASGRSRLASFRAGESLGAYLKTALSNFVATELTNEQRRAAHEAPVDEATERRMADTPDYDAAEAAELNEMRYAALLMTLEQLDAHTNQRDAYIWLTSAIASALKAEEGTSKCDEPLYASLARQLGVTEACARQAGSRMGREMARKARNILDILSQDINQ